MRNFWSYDDNFFKLLLKTQNNQAFLVQKVYFFSRELIELFKLNSFVLLCSPHLSGIIRLFSENNRSLLEAFFTVSFVNKSKKKKITSEISIFGIGLLVNFLRFNLSDHLNRPRNKTFPFFLFYFKKKMRNTIQKKFGALLSKFNNFSLFVLSKGILEENLKFLFTSNPFCLWWTIQLFFSGRIFKNFQNQKFRLGMIKFFSVLNSEFFSSKKKKIFFFQYQWHLGLYQNSFIYFPQLLSDIFFKCKFLMKRKKIEILRKIMLYLKYKIGYIGLKSLLFSSQKRFSPKISFWNKVSSGSFCLGEKEKGKRESRINENRKNLIRRIEIQRNRAGDFFPNLSEKIINRISKILRNNFKKSSIHSGINPPSFLFCRTFLFKARVGVNSQVSCMILDNYLEQVPYYNWPNFTRDIIETKVLSEILCKVFILPFISFKFLTYFLKPEKTEKFIAQTESILESFFSRKRNNLSYELFIIQTNEFVFWNFKKIQFFLLEFYAKNFPLINWSKKDRIYSGNSFFEYLKKGKNSHISEICVRKKCNYTNYKESKSIFLFIGNITNNEKYYEMVNEIYSRRDVRSMYFLSLILYQKRKFSISRRQIGFLLRQNLLKGKIHFLSGLLSRAQNNFWESLNFFSWIIKRHPFDKKAWKILSFIFSKIPLKENGIIIFFKNLIRVQEAPVEVSESILIHFLKTKKKELFSFLEIINCFFNGCPTRKFPSLNFFTKILNRFLDIFQKKIMIFSFSKKGNKQLIKFFSFIFKKKKFFKEVFSLIEKHQLKNEINLFKILTNKQKTSFPKRKKKIFVKNQTGDNELEILNRIALKIKNFCAS